MHIFCNASSHQNFRNVPIGFVVLVALTLFLRIEDAASENRSFPLSTKLSYMDPVGCVLFIASIVCLLLALQWGGQTKPWQSATIIGLLVAALALALIFIAVQWRLQDRALVPPRVFLRRSIWTGVTVLFFAGATTYVVSEHGEITMLACQSAVC